MLRTSVVSSLRYTSKAFNHNGLQILPLANRFGAELFGQGAWHLKGENQLYVIWAGSRPSSTGYCSLGSFLGVETRANLLLLGDGFGRMTILGLDCRDRPKAPGSLSG